MKPEHTECVDIELQLTHEAAQKYKKELKVLLVEKTTTSGDTLKVNYTFNIHYYSIISSLKAISKLCSDSAILKKVNSEALRQNKLLAYMVLRQIDHLLTENN